MHWLGQQGVRLSQPQGYVQIDWSNPITRGLVAWINPAVKDWPITVGKPTFAPRPAGMAMIANGSSLVTKLTPAFGSAATIFYLGTVDGTTSANQNLFALGTSGAGNQTFTLQSAQHALSGSATIRGINGGGATQRVFASFPTNSVFSSPIAVVARYSGSANLDLFVNGKIDNGTLNLSGFSGAASGLNNASLLGINRGTDAFASGSQFGSLGLAWNRPLSNAEILSISRNPWQIFLPTSSIWFPVSVTGGSNYFQSLSSSIVLSGVISKSIDKQTTAVLIVEGSQKKDTAKSAFNGVVQAASVLSEGSNLAYNATGSITPSGLVNSSATFVRNYLSQITLNGGLVRSISKLLTGSISLTGFAFKGLFKFISGSISISGILNSFKFTPTPGGLINRGMRFMRRFIGRR